MAYVFGVVECTPCICVPRDGDATQDRVFPLARCKFEHLDLACPKDAEYVLREEFGDDWRIPKKGFKTFMIDRTAAVGG